MSEFFLSQPSGRRISLFANPAESSDANGDYFFSVALSPGAISATRGAVVIQLRGLMAPGGSGNMAVFLDAYNGAFVNSVVNSIALNSSVAVVGNDMQFNALLYIVGNDAGGITVTCAGTIEDTVTLDVSELESDADMSLTLSAPITLRFALRSVESVVASDDFDRVNANPVSGAWLTVTGLGAIQLLSGEILPALPGVDSGIRSTAGVFPNNQASEITVGTVGGTDGGPMIRLQAGSFSGYLGVIDAGVGNFARIFQITAGSFSALMDSVAPVAPLAPDETLELRGNGTLLELVRNGTDLLVSANDGLFASGNPGVFMFTTMTFAAWAAFSLDAGGDTPPPFTVGWTPETVSGVLFS